MPNLNGWHLVIILLIVLILFGAPKLPGLAKSLGQSMRIFKGEMKEMRKDGEEAPADTTNAAGYQAGASQQPAATTQFPVDHAQTVVNPQQVQPSQPTQSTQVPSTNTTPGADRLS